MINTAAHEPDLLECDDLSKFLDDVEGRLLELKKKRETPVGEVENADRHLEALRDLRGDL